MVSQGVLWLVGPAVLQIQHKSAWLLAAVNSAPVVPQLQSGKLEQLHSTSMWPSLPVASVVLLRGGFRCSSSWSCSCAKVAGLQAVVAGYVALALLQHPGTCTDPAALHTAEGPVPAAAKAATHDRQRRDACPRGVAAANLPARWAELGTSQETRQPQPCPSLHTHRRKNPPPLLVPMNRVLAQALCSRWQIGCSARQDTSLGSRQRLARGMQERMDSDNVLEQRPARWGQLPRQEPNLSSSAVLRA
mmetsp:Transcript_30405/g.70924  ORF Transcript_30405/g.70924 Transcript_30405/m.70924 type:complete len:247 (-) Transcript_30405:57-797(-)